MRLELAHPDLEARMDGWLAERGASWRQLERGELLLGGEPVTFEALQFFLIHADPVLWAECNFIERDTGAPWRLFEYQKVGARYLSDAIWECGAETGKTRDIVIKCTWLLLGNGPRQRGDILVAGALDGNLEDIYDEQIFQLENNPLLHQAIDWEKSKVKPYKKLVAKNGNRIYYRPAGNDGRAFRGVHVGLAGLFDEAAKAHEKRIFAEFWRALKPTAFAALYSVPDGVTTTEFFRLCRRARAVDPFGSDLDLRVPGVARVDLEGESEQMARRERSFVKFRWPKTLMPAPYWTEERKRGYAEQYGGIESSDYQQNVLGNWGDPAASVFPWDRLAPCLKFNSDYRELQLVWNQAEGTVVASAFRLDPTYEASARTGDAPGANAEDEAATGSQPMIALFDDELRSAGFGLDELRRLFDRVFEPLLGPLVAGLDCGSNDDPTEILVFRLLGRRRRLVARLQLRRFSYPLQRTAARALDELLRPAHGWGMDSTGVGTALEHLLLEGEGGDGHYWSLEGRLSGFIANASMPDRNPETGEEIEDETTGKVRTVSTKEYGTRLMELGVQSTTLELVPTPDITMQFPQYRARKTSSGARAFDNQHDHTIDATRCALLRAAELEFGAPALAPIVVTAARGLARPSLGAD